MLRSTILAILLSSAIVHPVFAASDYPEEDAVAAEAYALAEAKWVKAERDRANAEMMQMQPANDDVAEAENNEATAPQVGN
jgi:hypothetical protein